MNRARRLKFCATAAALAAVMLIVRFIAGDVSLETNGTLPASPPLATTAIGTASTQSPSGTSVAALRLPAPAVTTALPLRQDLRWALPVQERSFATFKDWTERFARGEADEAEGIGLATRRRGEMAALLRADPERALALAVPETVRRQLPASVVALLETPVSGRGDIEMFGAVPDETGALGIPSVQRFAQIGDERYEAFVYGRRLGHPSRWGIPLHGYALDGVVALSDSPARMLEPVELAEAKRALAADPICSVSGLATDTYQEELAMDLGSEILFLCGAGHAAEVAGSIAEGEDALPPGAGDPGKGGGGVTSDYATTGARRMIMIRVGFTDYAGLPVSQADGTNVMNAMRDKYLDWSYGRFVLDPPGAGSVVTPLYTMPTTAAGYNGSSTQLHSDARAAATADGYNMANFDFIMVCFGGGTPGFSYGGLGAVGGKNSWIRSSSVSGTGGIGTHEMGHNFGMNHASYYIAPTASIIGSGGTREEYGDPYDTMGAASTNNPFSVRHKQFLAWVTNAGGINEFTALTAASGSTTNRIYAHDNDTATGWIRGVRIDRSASLSSDQKFYWLEFRTEDNRWSDDGVQVRWAGSGNQRPQLLDMTPDSVNDKNDAALLIGRTFSDTNYGIHITPVLRGLTAPDPEWIDVVVRYGSFPGNNPPTLSIAASATNVSTGTAITFTATAGDSDGDELAYFWDYGDNNYSSNGNAPVAVKSYSSAGERVVQCTVSDMKGGIAIASLIVRVGNPSNFRITGRALLHDQPMINARINASTDNDADLTDDRYTYTDSDGYYSLVGLSAASYTVTALHENHVFTPQAFTNPVAVGPTKGGVDFLGGLPVLGSIAARTMNRNATAGPVLLNLFDYESPAASLTLSGISGNPALVPPGGFAFTGTGTNRTMSVTPVSNASGVVTNQIVVTDADGFSTTNNFILNVNGPPVLTSATLNPQEDTTAVVDLWPRITDPAPAATADSNQWISVFAPTNGVAALVSNRFVQFSPPTNFFGTAGFAFSARDRGFDPRLLFYFDFEPNDTTADSLAADRSGNARNGDLEQYGTGSFAYETNNVPPALDGLSAVSLRLVETSNTNSARLYRELIPAEYNLNNADWSFTTWFRRETSSNDDFLFYTGPATGNGSNDEELQISMQGGNNRVRVRLYNVSNGIDMELLGPTTAFIGQWHHVALTYDRTNSNRGDFKLYFNGTLAASSNGIVFNALQTNIVVGGHNGTNNTQRWFNGSFDEVALWRAVLPPQDIAFLQSNTVAYLGGLSATNGITLNFQPVNDPPVLADISDRMVNPGVPVAFTNSASDPEVPGTQLLSFQILSAPEGSALDPATGAFHWRPAIAQAGETHPITLRVVDNGSPALASTQMFSVVVHEAVVPGVASMGMEDGSPQFSVNGVVGPDYIVQASTNMVTWTNLLVTNPVAFPFQWSDPEAGAMEKRFYRVLLGP